MIFFVKHQRFFAKSEQCASVDAAEQGIDTPLQYDDVNISVFIVEIGRARAW